METDFTIPHGPVQERSSYDVFTSEAVKKVRQEANRLESRSEELLEKAEQHEKQAKELRKSLANSAVKEELGEEVSGDSPERLREKIREHQDIAREAREKASAMGAEDLHERLMDKAEEVASEYEEELHGELEDLIEALAKHLQAVLTINRRVEQRIREITHNNDRQRKFAESSRDKRGEIRQVFRSKPPILPDLIPGSVGPTGRLKRHLDAFGEQGYSLDPTP